MLRRTAGIACLLAMGHAQAQNTANMVRGEYWVDQDLGIGANTAFEIADAPDVPVTQLPISLAGYGTGVHTIGIRTLDADGHWSLTNFSKAVVIEAPPAQPGDLTEVEYFLNEDPGFGNGLAAWTGSTPQADGITFSPDLASAVTGINTLFVRSRTDDGTWGLTNHRAVVVIVPEEVPDIVRVETFALPGPDPGFGMADQHIVSSPAWDLPQYVFDSPVPVGLSPEDTLMVRSLDALGRWSLTNYVEVEDIDTRVEDLYRQAGISVFPNPFTSGLTVRTDESQPLRVILYDPQGKLVHDEVLTGEAYIDLNGHASGAYTAFFWKEKDQLHRVTLIKQ